MMIISVKLPVWISFVKTRRWIRSLSPAPPALATQRNPSRRRRWGFLPPPPCIATARGDVGKACARPREGGGVVSLLFLRVHLDPCGLDLGG